MVRIIAFLLVLLPVCAVATIINVPSDQPTIQAGRLDPPEFLWTKTIGKAYVDAGVTCFETSDSGFLVLALSFTDNGGPDDWMVIRLAASGDTVWTSRLGNPDYLDRPKDALQIMSDKYIACGTSCLFGGETSILTVAVLDSVGQLESKITFGTNASLWGSCLAGEDRFIVVGNDKTSGSRGLVALMKYPLDTVWTMRFPSVQEPQETHLFRSVTPVGEGTYLACGWYSNTATLENKGLAVCFDTSKVVRWTKKFGNGGGGSCARLQNGILAVAGADSVPRVWLFDSTGVVLDSIAFADTLSWGIADISATIDGGFIIAGTAQSYGPPVRQYSKLIVCDQNYQPVWAKSFDLGYDDCDISSVGQTSDGGFVVCGTVNNSETQPDVFVCRTVSQHPYVTSFSYGFGIDPFHLTLDAPVFQWSGVFPAPSVQTAFEVAIGTDSSWTDPGYWHPSPFPSTDTFVVYDGAPLADGQTYYLRMRIYNDLLWSPWYNTTFRMNSVPGAPTPLRPKDWAVTNGVVTLWLQNAVDAESDPLTYEYTGFHDTDCVACPPIDLTGVPEGEDSTGAFIDLTSAENHFYCWWARAYDGFEYGPWSTQAFFTISGTPEAPTMPALVSPVDPPHGILYDMKPEFLWSHSYDPDPSDTVRYRLQVAIDPGFVFAMTVDSLTENRYTPADSLDFHEQYWWRVTAFDRYGLQTMSPSTGFWTWTLGDVDYSHETTMGDLTVLIDHLFISYTPIEPMKAGDLDGDCAVTMGDLTTMIDHLFISYAPLTVPGCQ